MLLIGIVVSICIQIETVWLRVLIKIAVLPLIVGVGYELIKLAGRKDNAFTRAISAPGLWMQRITTKGRRQHDRVRHRGAEAGYSGKPG